MRAGSSYLESGGYVYSVSRGYIHGYFNYTTADYDIAVLEVSSPFDFENDGIRAINLPNLDYYPLEGTILYVSGWGDIAVSK